MANTTVYPFGLSGTQPGGAWPQKIADIQSTLDLLAPLAFLDTPNPANPAYWKVCILPSSENNKAILRYGYTSSLNNYIMSPVFDLGDIGSTVVLEFSCGEVVASGQFPGIVYFNEDMEPYGYNVASSNPRSVSLTIRGDIKYCRLLFKYEHLLDSYLKVNGEYVFNGADFNTAMLKGKEDFLNSRYWLDWGPNSRGDWIGWNFASTDTAATSQRSVIDYPLQKQVGTAASPFSYSASKVIELPQNVTINVEFSCGVVNTDLMLRLLNPASGTANYYAANANPRTVSINTATWTHVQLYFLTANYADCYIKDATNNVILWQGAASTD